MGEVIRINGHKERLAHWTDDEVLNGLESAHLRNWNAEQDVNKLMGVAVMRGLVEQPEDPEPEDAA